MEHEIEFDCECEACKGTGLYVGLAERDGFAVVCFECKGTGRQHKAYKAFTGRKRRQGLSVVLEQNPGICVAVDAERGLDLTSFGGMPYEDWFDGKPFPKGSEMRLFTCPARWYGRWGKGKWNWCGVRFGVRYSDCPDFTTKEKCWERWDAEQ